MVIKNRAEQEAKAKHTHGLYVKPGPYLWSVAWVEKIRC